MSSLVKFPEPIQIVGYNPDLKKYQFDAKAFAKIATSDEIKDLPIAVVSIIGDNRKGKSFLLNYFLRYLQRYGQEDWLGDPNEPLQGFPWKQGTEKVTVGMVLWPEPLVITKKDGTKIAVLLMDTQGLFDHQSKDENYMDIFVISSLLSSVQVYNKSNNIQSNDIIQLSQLIKYLKEKQKNLLDFEQAVLLEKPEKLWFLVRDWAFECDHSFGAVGGRQFLNFKKSNQSDKFKQAWDTIDECYSEVDCFLMPHPGLDAINNPDFQGERCILEPDFVDSLRDLVFSLLSPENIAVKKAEDKPMKFLEFLKLVEIFGTTFSGNNYIYDDESQLAFEYIARTIEATRTANEMFISKMVENSLHNNVEQFKSQLESARWESISFYLKETQSIDSEIMLDSLRELEKSLKSHAISFERINSEVRPQPSSRPTLAVQRFNYKNLILLGARFLSPSFLFKLIRAHFTRNRR